MLSEKQRSSAVAGTLFFILTSIIFLYSACLPAAILFLLSPKKSIQKNAT